MKLIVIDTALGLCTAGVFAVAGEEVRALAVRSEVMTKGHQERLGGLMRDALAEAGGVSEVARIGVTVGPGSFTGLRVGLSFAQGLGEALGLPVIGLSTLDALAASAAEEGDLAALIDARRGQVYARLWRNGAPTGPAQALSLEMAEARVGELDRPLLVGNGAPLFAEALPTARITPLPGPAPEALARLAARAAEDAGASPLYLRAPDAAKPTRLPGQPRPPR